MRELSLLLANIGSKRAESSSFLLYDLSIFAVVEQETSMGPKTLDIETVMMECECVVMTQLQRAGISLFGRRLLWYKRDV